MAISQWNVYLFIPNLIGYLRIVFCAISYYYAFSDPIKSVVCYFIGQAADAVDGTAARYFGQVSRLGALLDMLTDRMGTAVLFIVLSHQYSGLWGFFAFLIVLDIVSHWFQMYATSLAGKTSHKGSDTNKLLNFYYNFPYALLVFCCGNEAFVMALYLLSHTWHPYVHAVAVATFPIFAGKQFMNFVQLWDCMQKLTALDAADYNARAAKKDDAAGSTQAAGQNAGHGHSHGGKPCAGH